MINLRFKKNGIKNGFDSVKLKNVLIINIYILSTHIQVFLKLIYQFNFIGF